MAESIESLKRKMNSSVDLETVVRTMKAMSASRLTQFEKSILSLNDYYHTIVLGLLASLQPGTYSVTSKNSGIPKEQLSVAIVFGSDIGLVGPFNDRLAQMVQQWFQKTSGKKLFWVIGERMRTILETAGIAVERNFNTPTDIGAITPLVRRLLLEMDHLDFQVKEASLYLFYNQLNKETGYEQKQQCLIPLNQSWLEEIKVLRWPTTMIPEVIGDRNNALTHLVREYLFVSLFKCCAESTASENASRLSAMQRAEKNIDEMLDSLQFHMNRLRQEIIDEELFDVIAGFEALRNKLVTSVQ